MGKKAFTNEQIVRILEEGERTDEIRAEFCRRQNISEATYYAWRKKFQGMQIGCAASQGTGKGERPA